MPISSEIYKEENVPSLTAIGAAKAKTAKERTVKMVENCILN